MFALMVTLVITNLTSTTDFTRASRVRRDRTESARRRSPRALQIRAIYRDLQGGRDLPVRPQTGGAANRFLRNVRIGRDHAIAVQRLRHREGMPLQL